MDEFRKGIFDSTYAIKGPLKPEQRDNWLNLNGKWQFAFDGDEIDLAQNWYEPGYALPEKINVPYCYQSELSGLHDKRLCPVVWYKRTFELPGDRWWDQRVFLRFGKALRRRRMTAEFRNVLMASSE